MPGTAQAPTGFLESRLLSFGAPPPSRNAPPLEPGHLESPASLPHPPGLDYLGPETLGFPGLIIPLCLSPFPRGCVPVGGEAAAQFDLGLAGSPMRDSGLGKEGTVIWDAGRATKGDFYPLSFVALFL